MAKPAYKRILLKVSGEVLAGDQSFGIETEVPRRAWPSRSSRPPRPASQIAIVIGAGNIFRGMAVAAEGADRVTADMMGMLGTVINSLALSSAHHARRASSRRSFPPLTMPSVADTLHRARRQGRARRRLCRRLRRRHRQSVLHHRHRGGAQGDRARLRRPAQGHQGRRRLFRGPQEEPEGHALRDRSATTKSSRRNLKVMDTAAFALARDNGLPILVYALDDKEGLMGVLTGKTRSTLRRLADKKQEFAMAAPPTFSLDELKTRMQKSIASLRDELHGPAHRPRQRQPARAGDGRGLRHAHAAQPGGDGHGAGGAACSASRSGTARMAPAVDKAIRNSAASGSIPSTEGAVIRVPLPELNEERRRELTKVAHNYAEAGARRGPPYPARRHGPAQEAREGRPYQPGRRPRASPTWCRRRPTRRSARSIRSLAAKEQEIMQV